jgi:hypothetical protein
VARCVQGGLAFAFFGARTGGLRLVVSYRGWGHVSVFSPGKEIPDEIGAASVFGCKWLCLFGEKSGIGCEWSMAFSRNGG